MYEPDPAALAEIDAIIRNALKEDIRTGDITTSATIPAQSKSHAMVIARSPGILAGSSICARIFSMLSNSVAVWYAAEDGQKIGRNRQVFEIRGSSAAILKGERTALNILGRMSGIATLTRKFVDRVEGTGVRILDTRKTMPGLRRLDKYAVVTGGGYNHRYALDDMFLIKENHIAASGGIKSAVERCLQYKEKHGLDAQIVAEAAAPEEADIAAKAGADRILLDNMTPETVREITGRLKGVVKLEVSGGITLANVREYAETGVDFISIGRLTHSAPAVDFSLLII